MPDALVLDTSAALALVLGEPDGAKVRRLLVHVAGTRLLVLDLFWLELVNILGRRYRWDPDTVLETLLDLDDLGIETVGVDRPLLLVALDLAARHGVTAYDAAHLALAESANAKLVTLDEELARAAGPRAVITRTRGTREASAAHGSGTWRVPDWTRHGRYLAKLRRASGG